MRLSHRVASAAVLILLSIFLVKYHLASLNNGSSSLRSFWKTSKKHKVPDIITHARTKMNIPNSSLLNMKPSRETTQIVVPNDRIIVMAKTKGVDTNWVGVELAEWKYKIYTVDDLSAPTHTPKNKGRESLAYLQYIVDHYNDLPSTIVFIHPHRDGLEGWHIDNPEHNNVESIRMLQADYIQKAGYANLRCKKAPGCPGFKPRRNPPSRKTLENAFAGAWVELFNTTNVPNEIAAPCCSQFAVSREQVLKRPRSDYVWFYNWVLETGLPDNITAAVLENTWHIIFGKDNVFCPDEEQCYEDVYGIPRSNPESISTSL